MSPHFHMFNKAFPTPATPVSVVVCVEGDDMPVPGRMIREPVLTEGAAVWPLSSVGPHMQGEVSSLYEPGWAHRAPVDLLAVGLHMIRVIITVKRDAALFTLLDHPLW